MLVSDRCPSQVSITRCGIPAFTVKVSKKGRSEWITNSASRPAGIPSRVNCSFSRFVLMWCSPAGNVLLGAAVNSHGRRVAGSAARAYAIRVFSFRMVTVKTSMNRFRA